MREGTSGNLAFARFPSNPKRRPDGAILIRGKVDALRYPSGGRQVSAGKQLPPIGRTLCHRAIMKSGNARMPARLNTI